MGDAPQPGGQGGTHLVGTKDPTIDNAYIAGPKDFAGEGHGGGHGGDIVQPKHDGKNRQPEGVMHKRQQQQ